jgi:formate hydrogenlyase subunit 4
MSAVLLQLLHMALALALAPVLTGLVRWSKARLLGRRGAPVWQPYRDLARLLRKDAVLAENASWLFRTTPYLVFAAVWLAASMVPSFTLALVLGPASDLIALVALLGAARFFTALAGLDVGTSFGGIGASREMTIASLAEPAMLMVIFTLSLWIGSTSLTHIAGIVATRELEVRVSLALALIAILMVAIAENARIPVDNPATHLELTMVHEAMVLEYSGRHLALIDAAAMLKLLLYVSLIMALFAPWGIAVVGASALGVAGAIGVYVLKVAGVGVALGLFEVSIAKMRVFRVAEFLGGALLLGVLATIFLYVARAL